MKNYLAKEQKGSVLLIAVILLFFILAIAIGLNALILVNLQTLKEAGNSIIAFYAADAGIEKALMEINKSLDDLLNEYEYSLSTGASYKVTIYCCDNSASPQCNCPKSSDTKFDTKKGCEASLFCIDSIGTYKGSVRAIEVEI